MSKPESSDIKKLREEFENRKIYYIVTINHLIEEVKKKNEIRVKICFEELEKTQKELAI